MTLQRQEIGPMIWEFALISALEEGRQKLCARVLGTDCYQVLNVCPWQGYAWSLSASAQHIKSSSMILRYSPSKMGTYSKQLCSLCRKITLKPAFFVTRGTTT